MNLNQKNIHYLNAAVIVLCLMPVVSPAVALAIGLVFSALGIRSTTFTKHKTSALQASIVLMGFGMNLSQVISTSKTGFMITAISVVTTITIGLLLGKFLKVESNTSLLIASGTAICGGSAIAAVASVIQAKDYQISFSLVVIFILNAIALFIFPILGHYFGLNQTIFGYWAAIAIHDTSSVVGAGAIYGAKALQVATIVKLTRALWIIPLSIVIALLNRKKEGSKVQIPWFIGLFVVSILFAHLVPQWGDSYSHLQWLGKKGMVIALFLIGSNISIAEAKEAGLRSFLQGILLWIVIASGSLFFITSTF